LEQNLGDLIVDHSKQWTGLQSSDLNSGLVLQVCGVNIRLSAVSCYLGRAFIFTGSGGTECIGAVKLLLIEFLWSRAAV